MTRLPLIDPETVTGKIGELFTELTERRTDVGPMVRGMANSTTLLRAYVDLSRTMKRSHFDRSVSERISLAQQQWLGCDYCIAAHTRAAEALGLSQADIDLALQGTAVDPKIAAIVAFGQQVVAAPSEVGEADIARLRELGWRDEQIADVVGLAALNLLTGGFNLVAGIDPVTAAG